MHYYALRVLALLVFLCASVSFSQAVDSEPATKVTVLDAVEEKADTDAGETARLATYTDKKELATLTITYKDGRVESRKYFLGTKQMSNQKITGPGKSVLEKSFYKDGKLMLEKKDGVRRFERRKLADGTFEAIRYKSDGKRPQMRRRVGPNGEFELTHYRRGADSAWFKVSIPGTSGNFEYQYFAKDGAFLRRVMEDDRMVVTAYDKNGDFTVEQVWIHKAKGDWKLQSVTERLDDHFRRHNIDSDGKTVKSVEDVEMDNSVSATFEPDKVPAIGKALLDELYNDDPTHPED